MVSEIERRKGTLNALQGILSMKDNLQQQTQDTTFQSDKRFRQSPNLREINNSSLISQQNIYVRSPDLSQIKMQRQYQQREQNKGKQLISLIRKGAQTRDNSPKKSNKIANNSDLIITPRTNQNTSIAQSKFMQSLKKLSLRHINDLAQIKKPSLYTLKSCQLFCQLIQSLTKDFDIKNQENYQFCDWSEIVKYLTSSAKLYQFILKVKISIDNLRFNIKFVNNLHQEYQKSIKLLTVNKSQINDCSGIILLIFQAAIDYILIVEELSKQNILSIFKQLNYFKYLKNNGPANSKDDKSQERDYRTFIQKRVSSLVRSVSPGKALINQEQNKSEVAITQKQISSHNTVKQNLQIQQLQKQKSQNNDQNHHFIIDLSHQNKSNDSSLQKVQLTRKASAVMSHRDKRNSLIPDQEKYPPKVIFNNFIKKKGLFVDNQTGLKPNKPVPKNRYQDSGSISARSLVSYMKESPIRDEQRFQQKLSKQSSQIKIVSPTRHIIKMHQQKVGKYIRQSPKHETPVMSASNISIHELKFQEPIQEMQLISAHSIAPSVHNQDDQNINDQIDIRIVESPKKSRSNKLGLNYSDDSQIFLQSKANNPIVSPYLERNDHYLEKTDHYNVIVKNSRILQKNMKSSKASNNRSQQTIAQARSTTLSIADMKVEEMRDHQLIILY
ncbi:UNKNOWN [Stylonychia lemnae]|uniref:Uncharacterized protein n=1 Tax=Stylonychia lemnae TaxID=5949 RepID=A0A078A085_STYLE|nr:UNKNOWN [Stylonychia lemnae]|eukprot:CDW74193.1 UNKNOWN [Stylonychia lemnae]